LIGGEQGRNPTGVGRKKKTLTRGPAVSAREREKGRRDALAGQAAC
jgi:hypothetical protein